MKITKQSRRGAKRLFAASQVDGHLDETRARRVVSELIGQKPRGYLGILSHFQRLIKLEIERRTARIESATPLTPEMEASVRARLESIYGKGLQVQHQLNPALIGGLRIQVGSDVYDGTIQARLAALKEAL